MADFIQRIQTGSRTITSSDLSPIDVTLGNAVTIANCIVMITTRTQDDVYRASKHCFGVELTSTTNLRFTRFNDSTTRDTVVEWTVLEFTSDVVDTIQSGQTTRDAAADDVTLGTSIDLADAWAYSILSSDTTSIGLTLGHTAKLTSTSNLRLESAQAPTASNSVSSWFVVELEPGYIDVQSGLMSITPSSGVGTNTAALSPSVDLDKSFLINAGWEEGNGTYSATRNTAMFEYNSSSQVGGRNETDGSDTTVENYWYSIEIEASGPKVESFTSSITGTNTTPATQPSWTALSTSNTAIMNGNSPTNNFHNDATNSFNRYCDAWVSIVLDGTADGATLTRMTPSGGGDNTGDVTVTGFAVDWTVSPITYLGATTIDAGAGNGSDSTVTIPSGATVGIIMCSFWDAGATDITSVTVDGQSATDVISAFGVQISENLYVASGFSTGSSKTVSWTFNSDQAISEGGRIYITWWSNADPTLADSDSVSNYGANELSRTVTTTDPNALVIVHTQSYSTSTPEMQANGSPSIYSVYDDDTYNNEVVDLDYFQRTQSSHTIDMTGEDYSSMIVAVLNPASAKTASGSPTLGAATATGVTTKLGAKEATGAATLGESTATGSAHRTAVTITDVDGDETISDGQTGVVVTGTNFTKQV